MPKNNFRLFWPVFSKKIGQNKVFLVFCECSVNQFGDLKKRVDKNFENFLKIQTPLEKILGPPLPTATWFERIGPKKLFVEIFQKNIHFLSYFFVNRPRKPFKKHRFGSWWWYISFIAAGFVIPNRHFSMIAYNGRHSGNRKNYFEIRLLLFFYKVYPAFKIRPSMYLKHLRFLYLCLNFERRYCW